MRRNSLVGPLLLIAVGALFLARNIYPDLPLLDFMAKYWPMILIGWGSLRIVEIVGWAAASKPLPVSGISGGEWVMIIFLCLFGAGLHTARGISNWWPGHINFGRLDLLNGERYEYPLSGEKSCSRAPRVLIEDFQGDAKINGVDAPAGADQVRVTGHKTIRSLDRKQADIANTGAPLDIDGDPNNINIHLHQDRNWGGERISATLDINVPKGSSVEVHGRKGDLEINDIAGSVSITSDNAGVRLKDIGGDARVNLGRSDVVHMSQVKGTVEIKGHGSSIELDDIGGPVNVSGTYNGTIDMRKLAKPVRFTGPQTDLSIGSVAGQVSMSLGDFTASNIHGPTHLSSRSRDVKISDFSGPLEITLDRGDLSLRPALPLGRIEAHLHSGDVNLSLPEAAQFSLNASTDNGAVSNPFGGGFQLETRGRRGTLRGAVGSGPVIEIATRRGDIAVQKAVVASSNRPLEKLDQ